MAGLMGNMLQSLERVSQSGISVSTGLSQRDIVLTGNQDVSQCVPCFSYFYEDNNDNYRANNFVGFEVIDDSGPKLRVHTHLINASGRDLQIEGYVLEFLPKFQVLKGTLDVLNSDSEETITTPTRTGPTIPFISQCYQRAGSGASDSVAFRNCFFKVELPTTTQLKISRFGVNNEWRFYYCLVSDPDSSDFDVEAVPYAWDVADQINNYTLGQSVTLSRAFVVPYYCPTESSDDVRDGVCNLALTSSTNLRRYQDAGVSAADGDGIAYVVRDVGQDAFTSQRFDPFVGNAVSISGALDQSVDREQTATISNLYHNGPVIPLSNTTNGLLIDNWLSCTVVASNETQWNLFRRSNATTGPNGEHRFEVIEFGLGAPVTSFPPIYKHMQNLGVYSQ